MRKKCFFRLFRIDAKHRNKKSEAKRKWNEAKTKRKKRKKLPSFSLRNEAKRKQKTAILFASKRNEAKRKRKTAIIFTLKWNRSEFCSLRCKKNEMKRKQNKKKSKTSKRKRKEWNLGQFVKNRRKILRLVFYFFMSVPSMVKKAKKRLFHFASKRNEKIGSETNNFCKQNKAKIRTINFASVGSEKFEAKKSENKICIFHVSVRNACETDLVLLWSEKIFFC